METKNTNLTAPMTKREKLVASLGKLCLNKANPAVNYQHIEAQFRKLKEMDMKGVR